MTIHAMRAGLTWFRLSLFLCLMYATSVIFILAMPVIAITMILLMLERFLHLGLQARPQVSQVRVLHVVQPPSLLVTREMGGYDQSLETAWKSQRQQGETSRRRPTAEMLRSKGLNVVAAVEEGDPKSKILDDAEAWHADLIVLGSHGRKGLGGFLLGGISGAVARHALCSVEIVRSHVDRRN